MERHKGYEGIDAISAVVAEAKETAARAQEEGKKEIHLPDVWNPALQPRAAVHAVTVPLLQAEQTRLEADIEEVRSCCFNLFIRLSELC